MQAFNPGLVSPKAKILIIKLRSIGDVVYNTSVYAPLKKRWPESRLTVIVEPPSDEIVKDHPAVDETICFKKNSWFKQLLFYLRLFLRRYDIAIDMHEGPRGAVMCFLTGARWRIGNKFAKRSFLYNTKLDFSDLHPKYPVDYQVALIRKMGVDFDVTAPAIYVSQSAREKAQRLLINKGVNGTFCIIHPGVTRVFDHWQPEKFAAVAEYCYSQHGLTIVLTCGPGQEEQAQAVARYMLKIPYAMIETSLGEMAAIAEKARFVICHNGGFMHLSAAMGTPVVALFGWANPSVWKPAGSGHAVVYKNLECSPCTQATIKAECLQGDPECKRLITVDDVIQGIEKVLTGSLR